MMLTSPLEHLVYKDLVDDVGLSRATIIYKINFLPNYFVRHRKELYNAFVDVDGKRTIDSVRRERITDWFTNRGLAFYDYVKHLEEKADLIKIISGGD